MKPIIDCQELRLEQDVKSHLLDLVEAHDCHLKGDCHKTTKMEVYAWKIKNEVRFDYVEHPKHYEGINQVDPEENCFQFILLDVCDGTLIMYNDNVFDQRYDERMSGAVSTTDYR